LRGRSAQWASQYARTLDHSFDPNTTKYSVSGQPLLKRGEPVPVASNATGKLKLPVGRGHEGSFTMRVQNDGAAVDGSLGAH